MIPIRIPAEDMKVLEAERYTHPHPRVQRQRHTLYLVGLGYPRHDVARIIGVSEGTVRNFIHAYQAGGLGALRQFNPHPQTAAWDRHATTPAGNIYRPTAPHRARGRGPDRIPDGRPS